MIFMDLPKRKPQRLKNYDYSCNGAYFITICTQDRLPLFGGIADGAAVLDRAGRMVEERLLNIARAGISVEKHCVMPDHIHAIILLSEDGTTQGSFPTTVSALVQSFKSVTTKLYIDGVKSGYYPPFVKKIWQKSFHDRILRDERAYRELWQYIDENPRKWQDDHFYGS